MPFISQLRRDKIELGNLKDELLPGDYCYKYYKKMIEKWKENPCWTVAHYIYCEISNDPSEQLAWQVFFQLHVIPYELKKRKENGDI